MWVEMVGDGRAVWAGVDVRIVLGVAPLSGGCYFFEGGGEKVAPAFDSLLLLGDCGQRSLRGLF